MPKVLTAGTPWRVIVLFAIPLLLGNVVQQLYQVVDAMVVGQHLGVNALAAVGTTGGLIFLLLGFAWGMTSGFAIPTAQAYGANDMKAVRRSVAAGTVLTGVAGLIITTAGLLLARSVLELLQTPDELLDQATVFAQVSFAGSCAIMFFNYLSAIIRAKGDSRTPLVFLVISCLANIGLVIVFVQYFGMGVGGAAGATVAAQLLSVLLCFAYIRRSIPEFTLRKEDWLNARFDLVNHVRIGLPMGFQASIIAIGTLAVQVRLNTLGTEAVAAYTTATRVDGLAVAFLSSIGIAVSTFVAQNYGAGYIDRIKTGVRQSLVISTSAAIILGITLILAGDSIIRLFVGEANTEVVSMAHHYLVLAGCAYSALGVLFVTRGALQGTGRVLIPTISGVLELTMRVGAAVILGSAFGFTGVVWASPLAWVGGAILLLPAWIIARRSLDETSRELSQVRHEVDASR